MIRNILLFCGCVLLLLQQSVLSVSVNFQFIIFLAGIILLGIPHGAADMLVASKNATGNKAAVFSIYRFLFWYVLRLLIFALVLYFFPVTGNLLFIAFAAYHFGETDLYHFDTSKLIGKLLVVSYGLVILSVILLHHFDDVRPLFMHFESGRQHITLINWIAEHRYALMSASGVLFFTSAFIFFLSQDTQCLTDTGRFLIHFAIIIFILYKLPMLLGFTFYFVVWHSALSLKNIVKYLRSNSHFSSIIIMKQIVFYSAVALVGIGLFGVAGFMFASTSAVTGYLFLGLAVLTAPHMQIMHHMYHRIRSNNPAITT